MSPITPLRDPSKALTTVVLDFMCDMSTRSFNSVDLGIILRVEPLSTKTLAMMQSLHFT